MLAVGAKVTAMLQLAPDASTAVQVVPAAEYVKSDDEPAQMIPGRLTDRLPTPVLVRTATEVVREPTGVGAKLGAVIDALAD